MDIRATMNIVENGMIGNTLDLGPMHMRAVKIILNAIETSRDSGERTPEWLSDIEDALIDELNQRGYHDGPVDQEGDYE